jgi:carbonic anhydrase
MAFLRSLLLGSCLWLGASACHQQAEAAPEQPHKPAKAGAGKADKADAKKDAASEAHADESGPQKYAVPFAWESSKVEPLSLTRSFLKDALEDNATYMEHGSKFFAAFADAQLPRATVVACSDARVQSGAWDVTPENDDFTVRNWGNQIDSSAGSVEFGVEQLNTPLLLIIGHTGCDAVRAAMGDQAKLPKAMQAELKGIELPKAGPGKSETQHWADASVANVHAQVANALKRFGKRVQSGQLTVVGAIYDFRSDLGQPPGKLIIVDVNGNGESERLDAFTSAISAGPLDTHPALKKGSKKAAAESPEDILRALGKVQGIVTHEVAAQTNDSPVEAK